MFYSSDDYLFDRKCSETQTKFAFLPKKCHLTGKVIWLKKAYLRVAMWTGPGEPIFEYRWYDKNEFLILRLKGVI